jgi:tetratricopeptide (TPR) repeat protein
MDAEEHTHLTKVRCAHVKRLRVLELKQAKMGLHAPEHIFTEIDELLEKIAFIDERLNGADMPSASFAATVNSSLAVQIEIVFRGDFDALTEEIQQRTVRVLAALVDVSPDQIRIKKLMKGSIIFRVEMPKEAADQLLNLYKAKDPVIDDIDIAEIRLVQMQKEISPDTPTAEIIKQESHHLHRALRLEGTIADQLEASSLHVKRAESLLLLSRYADAELAYQSGLSALEVLPDVPVVRRERARLLWQKSIVMGKQNRYAEAIIDLEKSLEVTGDEDEEFKAIVLGNLALFYELSGYIDLALQSYEVSLANYTRIGNVIGQVRILNNLAGLYMERGEYELALRSFTEIRATAEHLDLHESLARALLSIGIIESMRWHLDQDIERLARAVDSIQQARKIFISLGDLDGLLDCLYRLSDIALMRGDLNEAYVIALEALTLAREISAPAFEACALRVMGEARLGQNQVNEAAVLLEEALALQERVGDIFDETLIRIALARLAWVRSERELAIEHIEKELVHAREHHSPYQIALLERLKREYGL